MQTRIQNTLLGSVLVAATCSTAFAASPAYTYIEAGYVDQDVSLAGGSVSVDGFRLEGSFDINQDIYLTARLSDLRGRQNGVKLDYDAQEIGIGGHYTRSELTDIYYELVLIDTDIRTATSKDQGEYGYRVGVGVKSMVQRQVEVKAGFAYENVINNGDIGFGAEGLYHVQSGMAVGVGYSYLDGDSTARVFGRLYFK